MGNFELFLYFFLFLVPPVWQLALYISPPIFPSLRLAFLIPCYFLLYPPWECDRSHSLLCCIAFARGHRETAENLCRYRRPFKRNPCAGRGLTVTHPCTDPAKSSLTWVIAWHRTPTTYRTLSVSYFLISWQNAIGLFTIRSKSENITQMPFSADWRGGCGCWLFFHTKNWHSLIKSSPTRQSVREEYYL